ncbi:unnamed protein product [Hermetia illucens]|uniref:EB domain-containing protein n=1 Tax=Hermetia illucens TaxID=343691 RepID=A0A7R8UNV0_HERIL|nr:prion-like-(Q/N-rich) domain-bearing protein 25 [Hermetia illucens]CAD7084267.1 unnamed protein product [Hermetia illucens]
MEWFLLVTCVLVGSLQGSQGVIWPCSSNADCPVTDTECSELGACQCAKGYVFSEDLTRCLKAARFGEECEETSQCLISPSGTSCVSGTCQCAEGQQYIEGRCSKYSNLNEACTKDSDCYFGYDRQSVSCTNGNCRCSAGYYERYTNICRKKSESGEPCVVNADCEGTGFNCVGFKCQSESEGLVYKENEEGIRSKRFAKNNQPQEKIGGQRASIGDRCTNYMQECNGLVNSVCADGRCVCKIGYYEEDDLCYAELGEKAPSEDSCQNSFDPESGLCLCEKNFFYEPGLRECRKPIVVEEGRCVSDSQCSPFGASHCREERPRTCECLKYASYDEDAQMCIPTEGLGSYCEDSTECHLTNTVCSDEHICVCKENFTESGDTCIPGLGAECRSSQECSTENSVCDENVCRCANGYVNFDKGCLKEATAVCGNCTQAIQCQALMGDLAECNNNECRCSSASHLNNDKCHEKRMIGDSCKSTSECFVDENQSLVECRNSICQCKFGFVTDEIKKICIGHGRNSSQQNMASPISIVAFLVAIAAATRNNVH